MQRRGGRQLRRHVAQYGAGGRCLRDLPCRQHHRCVAGPGWLLMLWETMQWPGQAAAVCAEHLALPTPSAPDALQTPPAAPTATATLTQCWQAPSTCAWPAPPGSLPRCLAAMHAAPGEQAGRLQAACAWPMGGQAEGACTTLCFMFATDPDLPHAADTAARPARTAASAWSVPCAGSAHPAASLRQAPHRARCASRGRRAVHWPRRPMQPRAAARHGELGRVGGNN